MKRIFIFALLSIVAITGLSAFDGYVDITNDTGYTIYFIYVSHSDDGSWGDDMLGDDVLVSGDTYRVYLSDQPSSIFDIMVEDEDGDTYTFFDVDVEYDDITVTLDDLDSGSSGGSAGETTLYGPGGSFSGYVDIRNDTGYTIYYLKVSHDDDDSWGNDLLGSGNILASGDTFRVNLESFPSSIFDIKVEDEDGDTYSFHDVDVEYADVTVTLDNLDAGSGPGESIGEVTVSGPGGDFDGYVVVSNDTGFTGYYLYVKQGGKGWGPDLLGDEILPSGSSFTVNVRNFPNSVFDIRLEDEDGDSYTFNGVDIETEDVSITFDDLD